MIYIDFQGGAHGNYLEFMCNKYLAKVECNDSPFNQLGASHKKKYYTPQEFKAWHYFEYLGVKTVLKDSKIISIQHTHNDLLLLSSISLLRAGDYALANDKLEQSTYWKLKNEHYQWMLDNIVDKFFQIQIQDSYNAVKDPSWPDVRSRQDFDRLPDWIKEECLSQHKLKLLQLDESHPDCPRYVLREFFKYSFQYPEQSGFSTQQQKMTYDTSNNVFVFPYSCFYNTEQFINQINQISQWSGYSIDNLDKLTDMHEDFLSRQPYKNSKQFCDLLLSRIYKREHFNFPKLDLLQESYIFAHVEKYFGCKLPTDNPEWFKNSAELYLIAS
jgi:hypothetical protein